MIIVIMTPIWGDMKKKKNFCRPAVVMRDEKRRPNHYRRPPPTHSGLKSNFGGKEKIFKIHTEMYTNVVRLYILCPIKFKNSTIDIILSLKYTENNTVRIRKTSYVCHILTFAV